MKIINITTINESYYFIKNKVIGPNSTGDVDADTLTYTEIRDLIYAELNLRITLSEQDREELNKLLVLKDNQISEAELKTINGESIVGEGDITTNVSVESISDLESACHISGGEISTSSGTLFNVTSGIGYARKPDDTLVRITWNDISDISTEYDGANYIGFDYNSEIVFSAQPLSSDYCPIGYILTTNNNSVIIGVANTRITGKNSLYRLGDLFRTTIGSLVQSGVSTSMKPAPNGLELVISQGIVWHLLDKFEISETSEFTKLYNSANNFLVDTNDLNTINNTLYNVRTNPSNSALVEMTAGYYKKDIIAVTPSNKAYYVYGTSEWATEDEAKIAPSPLVPETIKHSVVRSAALIVQKGAATPSLVLDIRPMFTNLFETGAAASNATVISHSDLIDLNSDDHSLYHTDSRGDARYYRKNEVNTFLDLKSNVDHPHNLATTSASGYLSAPDKIKIDSIQSNATQNSTDAFLLNRVNHTGVQLSNTISDLNSSVNSIINTRIEDVITPSNTVDAPSQNAVNLALLTKANTGHLHTIDNITNLQSSLDSKSNIGHSHTSSSITDFTTAVRSTVIDDSITDGVTNKAPSQNAVFDSLALKANVTHTHNVSQITDYVSETDARVANYIATTSIDSLADVDTTGKINGQSLVYDSISNQWKPATPASYGDMFKSTYDTTNNGVVDNSEKLNNQAPSYYLSRSNHSGTQDVATISGLNKASVGLNNVDNTADINKPISNAVQTALNNKENNLGFGLASDYFAGDKSIKPLVTSNVAESVDKRFITDAQRTLLQNTSGSNSGDETANSIKTKLGIASASQDGYLTSTNFNTFNNKENALPSGTSTQYLRGNKTLATLDKSAVGLTNVQNIDTTIASNITSGQLPDARLNNTLQELSNIIYSSNSIVTYVDSAFRTTNLTSSSGNTTFNLTPSTLDINSKYGNHPNNPYYNFMEHFIGTNAASTLSPYFLRTVSSGSTTAITPAIGDNRMGVLSLNTGTTATGLAALSTFSLLSINFSNVVVGGYFETGCSFRVPDLSTSTDTFGLVLGFGDNPTSLPVDGAYVHYTTEGITARVVNNSTISSQALSGLSTIIPNTDYICKVRVTKTSDTTYTAEFSVNGATALITTGLPIAAGRETSLQYSIIKSVGTTSRAVQLDWIYFERYNPVTITY